MIELCVDGVAILTFGREDGLVDAFRRHKIPAVVVDIEPSGPLLKTVHIDYRHGIRQAVQHLAALGHVSLVADLYGDGTRARDMAQAMELMNGLRSDAGRWRARE